jgi:hypothetical protein
MPPLAYIGLKNGIGNKVIEFRWPLGKEVPASIRKLTLPEFTSALELASITLETMKSSEVPSTLQKLVDENVRLSNYIHNLESKIETNLETQMNEHTELLLSNHLLLKQLIESLKKDDKVVAEVKEKPAFKANRWQEHLFKVARELGVPLKEAMGRAKETYKKL